MMILLRTMILVGLSLLIHAVRADAPASDQPVTRILFGSCVKQDLPAPIFQTMVAAPADLAIFLGDNIYADTEDMDLMRAKYHKLAVNKDFARFRDAVPILATWDDHDYGVNDGGADYAMRDAAQKEFLDFWQVPGDSPRRTRKGVYESHFYGPVGKRLQVILLDTRYFRSSLKTGTRRVGGPYYPDNDPDKTMLGAQQWKWLDQQLRLPADLRVIATSIQCVAEAAGQETWSNLPAERRRLFELIKRTGANGVIFVSGDRHWSELSMLDQGAAYPIYELTSSSFNQIHARGTPTENRYRDITTTYHRENYGVIAIDWDAAHPAVSLQIRDIEGEMRIEKKILLGDLQR